MKLGTIFYHKKIHKTVTLLYLDQTAYAFLLQNIDFVINDKIWQFINSIQKFNIVQTEVDSYASEGIKSQHSLQQKNNEENRHKKHKNKKNTC